MRRGWFALRCGGTLAGMVMVVGLIGSGGCKNVQRGWPDAASGMLGYAEFCEADLDDFDDDTFGEDPFGNDECTPLPSAFAVGSRFRARVRLSEDLPDEVKDQRIEPASTEYVDRLGTELTVLKPGRVALLARGTREIVDYTMIGLFEVDEIQIELPPTPPLDRQFDLQAMPLGEGRPLGGELDYQWTATSEGIEIVRELDGGRAELLVTTIEDVTFEVSAGGHTEVFTLNAYPGPTRLRPAEGTGTGGSDTDGGTDTGSESGTDTGSESGSDTGSETGSDSSTGGGR